MNGFDVGFGFRWEWRTQVFTAVCLAMLDAPVSHDRIRCCAWFGCVVGLVLKLNFRSLSFSFVAIYMRAVIAALLVPDLNYTM
jgi:hypothetical protein